jgi:excisionase family DNA binding protein
MNELPILSVAQAAERLGVSRRTAYLLIEREGLPFVRILGRMRVPEAALERWIADRADEALTASRERRG